MRLTKIVDIKVGDVIVNPASRHDNGITVSTVELDACTKRKVHINRSLCWDEGSEVYVK